VIPPRFCLAIGLTFTKYSRRIGVLYFWNLVGSGAGGLLALGLMWVFPPREIPAILALIPVFSGLLVIPRKPGAMILIMATLSLICVTATILRPPALVPSEYKGLSRAMQLPEAQTTLGKNSPCGFMLVFSSPALRYAPELSLTYTDAVPARSWGAITFMVKKTPFRPEEISNIRAFCRRLNFDPALLPDIEAAERAFFNALQDDLFFNHLDQLLSSERTSLYAAYDFNIRPATDDRPYFAQFLRWKSLPNIAEHFGNRTVPFFEIGYLAVFLTLLQAALAAVLLIIVPLFHKPGQRRGKAQIFFYFSR